MDKTAVGLIGLVASLVTMGAAEAATHAEAAPAEAMQVTSYADLLKPIPNASVLLQANDAELAGKAGEARLQLVQYGPGPYYHHHHHHHHHHSHWYPPPPPPPVYHHHHHHHHGVTIVVPGIGAVHSE